MQRTATESLWASCIGELQAMKTILGHGPAHRNMQQFCDKITAITWTDFEVASLKKEEEEEEDEQLLQFCTARLCVWRSSATHFGNFTSLTGCRNTQRRRLGAYRSLKVICRRVIRNFLKCYIYCMSGPSLHRESTDSLILVPALICVFFFMQNSDFMTRLTSLYGSQTSSVVLSTHNSVLSTRINRLYWFQPSPVVLCMQNSDFRTKITSLWGS